MKVKSIILIIFVLVGFSNTSFSQKLLKVKKSEYLLEENSEGFNDAWRHIKKGNKQFKRNKKGAYIEALEHYLEANEYNNANARLNYLIAICYLKTSNKRKALEYIDKAYSIEPELSPDILYWKALALQHNNKFRKAKRTFEDYMATLKPKILQKNKMRLDRKVQECANGIELKKHPVRCFINNLGPEVNTKAPEYSPIFFFRDSLLYYTSRRETTTGGNVNPLNQLYYEDVYSAQAKNGIWHDAGQLGKPVNTKHNDAAVDVSPDGKEICIYRGNKGGGDLYNTRLRNNGKWSTLQKMRKIDKKRYRESSVSMTRDSMILYFISDRKGEGAAGGQDIWYSRRLADGSKWQKPQNLNTSGNGTKVNTKYDEETVEISADGNTLYFSSKGHNSMGGYDVFKTTRKEDGTWEEPVNIGYPINTPDDDVFFMLSKTEIIGYYACDRVDGYGDLDIYQIILRGPEKPTNISEGDEGELMAYFIRPVGETEIEKPVNIIIKKVITLKGVVTDFETGVPLAAKIELLDNSTGKIDKIIDTYPSTGAYSTPVDAGKDYALTAGAPEYFFHSENFQTPDTANNQVIIVDVKLKKMKLGAKIVLNNVFFDTGKATLRPESMTELNRLVVIMKQYPKLVIEIEGHTDSQGSAKMNKRLSQRRSQSVVNYLISQDISLTQLKATGYGEERPRADNKTKEGRQLNRRVEARILSR